MKTSPSAEKPPEPGMLVRGQRLFTVLIGYPGVVVHGRPIVEPRHFGSGWQAELQYLPKSDNIDHMAMHKVARSMQRAPVVRIICAASWRKRRQSSTMLWLRRQSGQGLQAI